MSEVCSIDREIRSYIMRLEGRLIPGWTPVRLGGPHILEVVLRLYEVSGLHTVKQCPHL